MTRAARGAIGWLLPVALLIVWEALARAGAISATVLPAPSAVLAAFWRLLLSGELLNNIWVSTWRALAGFAIGGSIGFGLGSLLAQGRTVSDMAVVLTAVLTILAVGIVIELLLFNPLEKRLLRGRGLLRS